MPLDDQTLARLLIDNVRSHAIISLGDDGCVTGWSAGAEAITGFQRDEILGRHVRELFTEADRAAQMPELEIATAIEQGKAEDSRWHPRRDGTLFWANGATVHLREHNALVKIFRDETAAKQADEHRVLLLNELNHRVKNTLATVQSVADHTLRLAEVSKAVRADLAERLIALSRAHNVLVEENWAGANLNALIGEVLAPYERQPSPFELSGPPIRLHPSQAVAVSLACHELATNAAKYGALSSPGGRVKVAWNLAHNGQGERFMSLLWEETGGPPVEPPTRTGFGTRLINQTFAGEAGGRAEITYAREGIRCAMALALLDEAPQGDRDVDQVAASADLG
ncbi:MAG: HWE histidine kinase domain-containing protein [Pseudomonadota bacterium]|nr:HWE histidine kinase domain-containing protein [Pseudomonadota bacterium]